MIRGDYHQTIILELVTKSDGFVVSKHVFEWCPQVRCTNHTPTISDELNHVLLFNSTHQLDHGHNCWHFLSHHRVCEYLGNCLRIVYW